MKKVMFLCVAACACAAYAVDPSAPAVAHRALMWLDASDVNAFTLDGNNLVERWWDARDVGTYANNGVTNGVGVYQDNPSERPNVAVDGQGRQFLQEPNNTWLKFDRTLNTVRTVFLIRKGTGWHIGDLNSYHLHRGSANQLIDVNAHIAVRLGYIYASGEAIDWQTHVPNNAVFTLYNFSPLGDVITLSTLMKDRNISGRTGNSDYCEILLFDFTLTEAERFAVESYLSTKWILAWNGFDTGISPVPVGASPLVLDSAAVRIPLAPIVAAASPDGGILKTGRQELCIATNAQYGGETRIRAGTLTLSPFPTDGLVCRLDASAAETLSVDGSGGVSHWADADGRAIGFSTVPGIGVPALRADPYGNGRPSLYFSNARVQADAPIRPRTVMMLYRAEQYVELGGIWGYQADSGVRIGSNPRDFWSFAVNDGNLASGGGMNMAVLGVHGIRDTQITYGTPAVLYSADGFTASFQMLIGGYFLNAESPSARNYRGDISEVLIYDRILTLNEMAGIDAYLSNKWIAAVSPPTADILPPSPLALEPSGVLELYGHAQAVPSLSGYGRVQNTHAAPAPLTVNAASDCVFSGYLRGNLDFIKDGPATLTLNRSSQSYSGETRVRAGTLKVSGQTAFPPVTVGLLYQLDSAKPQTITFDSNDGTASEWHSALGSVDLVLTNNGAQKPIYGFSAAFQRQVMQFDNQWLWSVEPVPSVQTVFIACNVRGTVNLGGIWGEPSDFGIRLDGNTAAWQFPGNGDTFANGGTFFLNGIQQASNAAFTLGEAHFITAARALPRNFNATCVGNYFTLQGHGSRHINGEIAELLAYNRELTVDERMQVEGYLTRKWGIGLGGVNPGVGETNVLPTNTVLRVEADGVLDLSGEAHTVGSLTGSGTVSNGTLVVTGSVEPEGTLRVHSLQANTIALGAGDQIIVTGETDVSGSALFLKERPQSGAILLRAEGGGSITGEAFRETNLSPGWKIAISADNVRVYISGTMLLIR